MVKLQRECVYQADFVAKRVWEQMYESLSLHHLRCINYKQQVL